METPSRIRGLIVSRAIAWLRNEYGNELVERALSGLSLEERRQVTSPELLVRWVTVDLFEKVLTCAYKEVFLYTGESREDFDRKGMEGGGGNLLKEFFLFVFSMITPIKIWYRLVSLRKRFYSNGEWNIIKNVPGEFSMEIKIPSDMVQLTRRELNYGYSYLIKLANVRITKTEIQEIQETHFIYKIEYMA